MARKKPAGPGSFCEWVIGTTIESALGPIPKRPPRRDVLRLELSTDDESETDRIKITYPRTRNSSSPKQTEVRVKKVRFEDGHPRKSALKKAEAVVSESDDEPTSDSETDASAEETSEQSSEEEENLPAKPQKSKKNKRKKMKKRPETAKTAESTESDEDSEPHPTCKCTRCIQGRQKAKRQKKAKNKKDQASLSDGPCENEKPRKSKKSKTKKTKDMSESSETDTDATDTSAESEKEQSEEGQVVKKPKQKTQDDKAKPRAKEKEKKLAYNSQAEETKEDAAQLSDTSPKNKNKKGNYPEASPLPHPRRPHYIEPVRAEVVQTERVIETPQDPPPNAFYDAEHNIVRVYHGPIWGANPNHSLYPRRDASLRPLPIGVPHPTQNPYYYGFASVAQPPAEKPGIAPNQQDGPAQSAPEVPEGGCNGAWSNFAKNHGPPSSKDKDAGGLDNISPQTHRAGDPNPYYTPSKLLFSKAGSQQGGRNKAANSDVAGDTWGGKGNSSTKGSQRSGSHTRCENYNGDQTCQTNDWNNSTGGNNEGQSAWGANGDSSSGQDFQTSGGWNEGATNHEADCVQNGSSHASYEERTGTEDNNVGPNEVMPGQYPGNNEWRDTSMAADTGGAIQGSSESAAAGW